MVNTQFYILDTLIFFFFFFRFKQLSQNDIITSNYPFSYNYLLLGMLG